MPIPTKLPRYLLGAAQLLNLLVLPGTYVVLVYHGGGGNLPLYVFWTWEWLAGLLPVVVAGVLVWRLWQRRWGQAVALALLLGVDVVARYGYYFAFFVSGMATNPT